MVWWINQMPGCYMSWAKEPKSCYNPTSGAPRDSLSLLHTWSAAVLSQVIPKLSVSLLGEMLIACCKGWTCGQLQLQSFTEFFGLAFILWTWMCSFGKWHCLFFLSLPWGDQEGRLDLSHPVHVDNCLLEPEVKQCWREPPAFIHRDLRYTKSRENTIAKMRNCVKLCAVLRKLNIWISNPKTMFATLIPKRLRQFIKCQ